MTFADLILCLALVIYAMDRTFYWLVAESDWKQTNQELHTQCDLMAKQVGGMVTLVEEFKASERNGMEYIARLRAENDELRKSKTAPLSAAN
jgi:peptidoglycan hydrolase CwlO-like protein